ncbi:MAG: hypothetical protein AB1896_19945 [Thermodesulfobacteriota bacterium]
MTGEIKAGDLPLALTGRRRRQAPYYKCLDPLVPWSQVQRPVDWPAEFGREAPLEVEMGFGNGETLVRHARERTDLNLVGIELAWDSVKRALRRLAKEKIANVRLLQADAHLALERLFAPRSITRAYSLFPLPWPKERHERRRVFSRGFLRLLGNRLDEGGHLLIVTDWLPLVEWTLSQVPDTGLAGEWRTTPAGFDTKYERKWRDTGQEVFYEISLVKERHLEAPVKEDLELLTLWLDHFDPETYEPRGREGPITVKFKEYLWDPRRQTALVRAFVAEDRLIQDVWIRISRQEGRWRLTLSQSAQVVPTEGLKQALELAQASALLKGR